MNWGKRWVLGLLITAPALAQNPSPVATWPTWGTTAGGNASSTITSTGVFQKIWSGGSPSGGAAPRRGCTIQNNGTHVMYVTEGLSTALATTALATQLVAGQVYYCSVNGLALIGEIDITGNSGDAFYAAQY